MQVPHGIPERSHRHEASCVWVNHFVQLYNQEYNIDSKFLPDLFTFTDLDNDGIVETTLSYSMICTGDVSPKLIKTIMREGGDKYAVRGESLVRIGKDISLGRTFKTDDSLNTIPVFKDHLITIWKIAAGISSHPKDKK